MTAKTFYIAGFTVATGAKYYVFSHDGKAGLDVRPYLFADQTDALRLAEQAARDYPLHAVPFVAEAS